jgi:hypothetical protein
MNRASQTTLVLIGVLLTLLTACAKRNKGYVEDSDPEMAAAIAKAQQALPQFWQVFDKQERGESNFVPGEVFISQFCPDNRIGLSDTCKSFVKLTHCRLTAQSQRPGPRGCSLATATRWPGSLHMRMVTVFCRGSTHQDYSGISGRDKKLKSLGRTFSM